MNEEQQAVVDGVSKQIARSLAIKGSEERYPSTSDADRMDATIQQAGSDAARLRVVREELENIFTGSLK